MSTSSLHTRIRDGLATRKYTGDVSVTVVVARYTQDITPEVLQILRDNNVVCHHLGYDSEENKPKRDAADRAIIAMINEFVADPENAPPQNIMVCSSDGFFHTALKPARD
ncbi:unnamed protein product [Microthlaspi erraticum]|uniref:NYN domain-containing protein n=1 Tax=Microthlaspi erraticum TaxID=1685480 RepID=A0A6D2K000_9BRAS|nr:unnamed protein product [Microthlaspi erraticum]